MDGSCRVIDASARFAARRPVRAAQQLYHASEWLADAAAQLQRASVRLRHTVDCMALAPADAAGAPERLTAATRAWLDATVRLSAASDRLDTTMARVLAIAQSGGEIADTRPRIAAPRPVSARWFLQYCPSRPGDRIRLLLARRRRSATLRVADAPKSTSPARAPPSFSISLL
jgi:hypothetical protein